jgi:hypothetical protein
MLIQVRIEGPLTPEQDALEDKIFEAAEILRKMGYHCHANKIMCFSPKDCPANILFEL